MFERRYLSRLGAFSAYQDQDQEDSLVRIDLLFKLTQAFNQATATSWLARDTGVAPVENKPVVYIHLKLGRHNL